MRALIHGFLLCLGLLGTGKAAFASEIVLSVISGGDRADYTIVDLDEMPQSDVITDNEFVDGLNTFTGPLVRDVLPISDANLSAVAEFIAVNDYVVDIPIRDFVDYPVIMATRMNGERLSLRDKGPIWVIYPQTDYDELRDTLYNSRLIWQLRSVKLP